MDLLITPKKLCGTVTPPPSKSLAHRWLLAAALGDGVSRIENVVISQDIEATVRCLTALGSSFSWDGDTVTVTGLYHEGAPDFQELPRLDCGESGSTLRFLIPVALAVAGGGVFTGHGRLMERTQKPYFDLFSEKGIFYSQENGELTVRGRLTPGEYRLPGNVSSQFFTGLLYALPLLDGPSHIFSTTMLESGAYLDMTVETLIGAGVMVTREDGVFHVAPASFQPVETTVESDWSQAGFWYAAGVLGSQVELASLREDSSQGDRVVAEYAKRLSRPGDVTIDVSQCPDLAPALAAMAAVRQGSTHLVGARRLRIKESDRLAAICDELCKLGGDVTADSDSLLIRGVPSLRGGRADGCGDHRIAMMVAVAATAADGPVALHGAECVAKSYPDFWEVYTSLGGEFQEV